MVRTIQPGTLFRAFLLATVVAILVLGRGLAYADRPGSYDSILAPSPSAPARAAPAQLAGHRRGHFPERNCGPTNFFLGFGPTTSWWPYGSGYSSWGYSPSGIYFNPSMNYAEYYLPPIYAPAELSYGPLAAERFFGYYRNPVPTYIPPTDVTRPVSPEEIADKLRKSNDESRQTGRRFIAFGDALFRKQRFHEALQRYKSAIEVAPDLAEAYYRQGFALIAVNQFELAVKAFRISLELDPGIIYRGPELNALYGENRLAKTSHLEALAGTALDRGGDPDLLFLVGMFLHGDRQLERSKKFFVRAAAAAGPGGAFMKPLIELEVLPDPPPPTAGDIVSVPIDT